VKNTGKVGGDEVVELYLSNLEATVPVPIHALKAFKRIYLLPGETKTVELSVPPNAFSVIDNNNKRIIHSGKFQIFVGGRQPDHKDVKAESGILKSIITLL
jgi:beta-glucosidase